MTSLPSLERVHAEIRALASGRRRLRFFAVAARVLFHGLVVVAVAAWFVSPIVLGWCVLGAIGLALSAGLVVALALPVDPVAIAKRYDDVVGTRDLLSSSLELEPSDGEGFVEVVREQASAATGGAAGRTLFPLRWPREVRWIWAPATAIAIAATLPLWRPAPVEPVRSPRFDAALLDAADAVERLLADTPELDPSRLDKELLERMRSLAEAFRKGDVSKAELLAEIARLASQLDDARQDEENRRLAAEKNAARLAKGEDAADSRSDIDAGRYREAANKIEKKIADLERQLAEAIEKKLGQLEIDKLRERIEKLKELLAELENLDALGGDLGFLVETLELLERIEGELGELGEFDGEEFDDVEVGRGPRRPTDPGEQDGPRKLFATPSSDAGKGHAKNVLGDARRSLSEGEEHEARLREGKGKSAFGQVKTANDGSRSRTEYREAFLAAQRAADDAIHRQNIPVGYRTFLRRYFGIMQPDEPRGDAAREDK